MPKMGSDNYSGGGGGFYKRKDATIVDVQFNEKNPFFKGEAKADAKPQMWAILTILRDGAQDNALDTKALRVGFKNDLTVVCDGRGVSGDSQFRKTEQFQIFTESLEHPRDGGEGIPADFYPEDPEGKIADYSNLRGVRVMFDEVLDESDYAKKNPRKAVKDGKPVLDKNGKQVTYPLTNIVVAQFYGVVDVTKLKTSSAPKPAATSGGARTAAKVSAPAAKLDTTVVAARAEVEIKKAVEGNKGKPLSKNKLLVRLLSQLSGEVQELNDAVRLYAESDDNLKDVDGVTFNGKELTLDAA